MGKFTGSTAAGQAAVLDEASIQLPIEPSAPTGGGSVLDGIIEGASVAESAPETAPVADPGTTGTPELDQAALDQRARDAVPSLKVRQEAADTGRYDVLGTDAAREAEREAQARARLANTEYKPDGGFLERALNFETALNTPELPGIGGLTAAASNITKDAYLKAGLVDATGKWQPQAGLVMSAVTENFVSDRAFGKDIEEEIDYSALDVKESEVARTSPYSKAKGRAKLGRQIAADNARMQGAEPPQLTQEEAEALGDTAQELYYEVNKQPDGEQFMIRTEVGDGEHKQTAFQLTQKGSDLLTLGEAKRKRLFPKQHTRTQKAPLGSVTPEAREYTKQVSSKAGVKQVRSREQREALRNLNKVANVVDPQRNKILLLLGAGTLRGQQVFNNDVMFISDSDPQGTTYNLAQDIYGIQLEKDSANYLTYYVQDFNGRMAPQQTTLDPTSSKAARFVTRNAIPADTSNSRIKRNLQQMYAMHLVPDEFSGRRKPSGKRVSVDQFLPAERQRVITNPAVVQTLSGWGKEIKDALAQIDDNLVNQVSQAIRDKTPAKGLPELPPLNLSPKLVEFINSKGEDGMMVMDGLVDFHNYTEAEKAGRPHQSYFNATMDGKTNGIASNGIQVGSSNVASKTGVIRSKSNNTQILDNGVDIRDDLELVLNGLIDQGFDGKFEPEELAVVRDMASQLASNRQFNKDITMTFGYGKEIKSFKKEIKKFMEEHDKAEQVKDMEEAVDAVFQNYVPAMEQVMDEDALAARAVMRSSAWLAAWHNVLFEMDAPLEGQKISLGATTPAGYLGSTQAKIWTGTGYREPTISRYGQEATSAAEKSYPTPDGDVQKVAGDVAYGGSIPGPVQSLDAATVTRTLSGKSWDRLDRASKGKPYVHTVYDAFKTDANGFDVILEETNKNWLDLNMNWSYLESMNAANARTRQEGKNRLAGRPDSDTLTESESLMLRQWIKTNDKGELEELSNRFKNLMERPAQAEQAAQFVKKKMVEAGYKANATPTVGQLKAAIAAIERVLDIDPRMKRFIDKTNTKKQALKQEIKAAAPKKSDTLGYDLSAGAQYYAH